MTALHLFWMATVVGAGLFFVAGHLFGIRRSRHTERAENPGSHALTDERAASHATIQQLREQLVEEKTARDSAETRLAAISSLGEELESRSKSQQRALTKAKSELAELQAVYEKRTRELAHERQNLGAVSARAAEVESLRGDNLRLRSENTDLRHALGKLESATAELNELKAKQFASTASTAPALPICSIEPTDSTTVGGALQRIVDSLAQQQHATGVVIADSAGFPVVASGTLSTPLAGYASLVCEVALRAASHLPIGAPDHVTVVDLSGSSLAVWPFQREDRWLSLVVLNAGRECDPATLRGAVEAVGAILERLSTAA